MVLNRRAYGIFEIVQIFLGIGDGILGGLNRVIKAGAVLLVVGMNYVQKELFAQWIAKRVSFDFVHNSYLSLVYSYHMYNNPIAITFVNILSTMRYKFIEANQLEFKKLFLV
jgi:hypothetical protein